MGIPLRGAVLSLVLASSMQTPMAFADPNSTGSCFSGYLDFIERCDDDFGPDAGIPNPAARTACLSGAFQYLTSCLTGETDNNDQRIRLFLDYLNELRGCVSQFPDDAELQQACMDGALEKLKEDLRRLENKQCTAKPVGGLHHADLAIVDDSGDPTGETYLAVDTALKLTTTGAGGHMQHAVAGSVAVTPCSQVDVLYAFYETPGGVVAELMGSRFAETGEAMAITIPAAHVVHTNRVTFVSVSISADGSRVFGDGFASVEILDSAVPGDWDRDGAKTSKDMIAFNESYTSGMSRADVNGDGAVDANDMLQFMLASPI